MAVTLIRAYAKYPAGAIVELTAELETSLIAQGLATLAVVANVTTGNQTADVYEGTVAIAAGASSVVITNAFANAQTKVHAVVAQAAADATLLRVERVLTADGASAGLPGTITIYGTANATATTLIDWVIVNAHGATVKI